MRDFSIVRQFPGFKDHIGLPYIKDLSNCAIEIIEPEYIEGYFIPTTNESAVNTPLAQANMKMATFYNTDYDALILPASRPDSPIAWATVASGIRIANDSGNLLSAIQLYRGTSTDARVGYALITSAKNMYVYISMCLNDVLPVIGIKTTDNLSGSDVLPQLMTIPLVIDDDMRSDDIREDDMRSDETPAPDSDEVKDEPADPEPETKSTRKK